MAQPVMQHSFVSGEWAPSLNARVDLQKYHSGAALLRNFFVDYRGGATTRPGSAFVAQGGVIGNVRVIPFQASQAVSYILEFGAGYIRFYNNGAPVLVTGRNITGITNANPGVVTSAAHGFANSQRVFISGVGGMTQLNGGYFIIANATTNTFTLQYLDGTTVDTTTFGVYTSGGTAQLVYTVTTTYTDAEIFQIKFVQNVNVLILTHPNHAPAQLVLNSATSWTLSNITFGSTLTAPVINTSSSSLPAGSVNYGYVVTAVDANGQESAPSSVGILANLADMRATNGTNFLTWGTVAGAVSYNVYRTAPTYGTIPSGPAMGFVGNLTGLTFTDSNIVQNFAIGPPIVQNPFAGAGVSSVTVTANGSYSNGVVPSVSFTGGGGTGAAAYAVVSGISSTLAAGGANYTVGDTVTFAGNYTIQVTATFGGRPGPITAYTVINTGTLYSGNTMPMNPTGQVSTSGGGTGAQLNITWGVTQVNVTSPGTGYTSAPTVVFSYGGAAATATIGASSAGNPAVPGLFQQRLVLAGPKGSPAQFNMSTTGALYNYNINNPLEASDAIQGTIVSAQLNTIQAMISQPYGLIMLTDKGAWLINGGSAGSAVTPSAIVANPQIYNGIAPYVAPIIANDNILYVQAKNSIVRNLIFNYYTQIYTGSDISIMSSHLFYGFQIVDWAYAEEPYKLIWAARNDGILLCLTFLREQELIAWSHHDTNGAYKSVASVTELTSIGYVDAIYLVVQRSVNGIPFNYIERFVELTFPNGRTSSKQVDASISYSGAATTSFTNARHLAGLTVTGVADGNVITPFVMPANGSFSLPTAAANVTIGLAFTPQLQTLQLDLGEPTVQGKRKKITAVTTRVKGTLGLQIGRTFATAVNMKDLVVGNVGTMTNQVVTDLVTGDARTIIDPLWDVPGQYAIQQPLPYPATILGVIPEIEVGDTPK